MDFESLKKSIAGVNAQLVAVSKTHPPEVIKNIYNKGQFDFGENKVQELLSKVDLLPADIRWHMIGHLQSNKVKQIIPFVHLIHSLDRLSLAKEIEKQAERRHQKISVLLQFKIADEGSKFGILPEETDSFADQFLSEDYQHITVKGVMGMATFTDDEEKVRGEFRKLNDIFHQLKEKYFQDQPDFSIKSYGMSGDYQWALEEGSNMVRIGSLIFGERNYE